MTNSCMGAGMLSLEKEMPLWLRRLIPRKLMDKAVCSPHGPVLRVSGETEPRVEPVFSAMVLPVDLPDEGRVLTEVELIQKKQEGALPRYCAAFVKCKMVDDEAAREYVRDLLSTAEFADNGFVVLLREERGATPVVGVSMFRRGADNELMRICVVPSFPAQMKIDVRRFLQLSAASGNMEDFILAWCAVLCRYDLKESPIFRGMRFKWLNMMHPQAPIKAIVLYMARVTVAKKFRNYIRNFVENESSILADEGLLACVSEMVDNLRHEIADL